MAKTITAIAAGYSEVSNAVIARQDALVQKLEREAASYQSVIIL